MIYVFIAMYAEAKPLIERLKLKKINSVCKFAQYRSEKEADVDICLTITGCGSVAASTAVGAVCACGELCAEDVIINIGTAAGALEQQGNLFLIHKITEQVTERTFYPDILFGYNFEEAEVLTMPTVVKNVKALNGKDEKEDIGSVINLGIGEYPILYDMEAAGIYQAANYFVGPHQMHFLKIVSDAGVEKKEDRNDIGGIGERANRRGNSEFVGTGMDRRITFEDIGACMEQHVDQVVAYIRLLSEGSCQEQEKRSVFSGEELLLVEKLCEDLRCSATMGAELRQLCRYWKLAGVDYVGRITKAYEEGELPCKDKRRGKGLLDEWKRELL